MSSAHITFIDEAGAAECERRGWLIRHGVQYHWFNRGYASFDDFLGALDEPQAQGDPQGARRRASTGSNFGRFAAARSAPPNGTRCGRSTRTPARRKWGRPYLTREFFDLIGERMGDRLLLFLACRDGGRSPARSTSSAPTRSTAATGAAIEEVPFLHFELCYYQAIEWAIEHGLACVQAGAQGEHKVARGYEPVITTLGAFHSEPRASASAVAEFLEAEREGVAPKSSGCGATCPTARRRRSRSRPCGRSASAIPRYIAGVVKPHAASPSGATAISPPLPPSASMSASTASSACCSDSPPSRTRSASWCAATARMKYSPEPVADTAAERSSA